MAKGIEINADDLELINRYAVTPLTEEQVYCFRVVLCDNLTDRDGERFSKAALEKLAELFVGKTGIFDHSAKGSDQNARLYRTEVETDPGEKVYGEDKARLIGWAYMVRTADNESLIAEIDGGIKKEVSVGCSVGKKSCSVCGKNRLTEGCSHVKGRVYDGKVCCNILEEPTDAYEWSFVAVPAQRGAGVTKRYEAAFEGSAGIRREIIRLSYFAQPGKKAGEIRAELDGMDIKELIRLRDRLLGETKKQEKEPVYRTDDEENERFKIETRGKK
ncbi:MAG: hypothetical protein IJ737_07920 [Ruminococcus sp.]|nr:hypothetical protein [Ruminococcus sp.]